MHGMNAAKISEFAVKYTKLYVNSTANHDFKKWF